MNVKEIYYSIGTFHNELARVSKTIDGILKWGYVNTEGKEVVPCVYDSIWNFNIGFAYVMKKIDGKLKWGYVNTEGKEVVPCAYGWHTIDQALKDYIKKEQIEKFLEK